MKKYALFLGILVLFFFSSCERSGLDKNNIQNAIKLKTVKIGSNKYPKIVFKNTTYDAGEVVAGENVPHSFEFVNEGKGELVVKRVRSTCGCTVAKLDKNVFEPGEKGKVEVIFHSSGYGGNVIKRIYVYSNDPKNPRIGLNLKCFVKKYIDINPRYLSVGAVEFGKTKTVSVMLKGDVEKHFKVTGIKIPDNLKNSLTYKIEKVDNNPNRDSYKIDLIFSPKKMPLSYFGYNLLINTDSTKMPVIPIAFRGEVVGPIKYFPKVVNYTINRGQHLLYTINLTSMKNFIIKSAKLQLKEQDNNIKIKVNKISNNNYTISVFSINQMMQGIHGKIIINTNINIEKQINIPINIRVI